MYPVLCFVAILTVGASAICDYECKIKQRASLEILYQTLDGQHWARREGWESSSLDHCSWAGVHCCANQYAGNGTSVRSEVCPLPGGVVGLEIPQNNATGPWPAAALAGLANSLAYLNLRGNNLQGQLPASVKDLSQLSVLYVDNTGLSGLLPAELGQLLNLTQLSASGNSFSGPIPASLVSLQRLRRLSLHDNQLTGQFPASLLSVPQLQQLDVSRNLLTWQLQNSRLAIGVAPADAFDDAILGALAAPPAQIAQVNFSTNKLSGSIPTSVALLPTMVLDLSNNQLSGSIPAAAFGSNQILQELLLGHNRLSGTLNPELFRGNLCVLDLSSNALTGTLPALFGIGGPIVQLDLSNNSLVGPLPSDVRGQFGSLQWLNLAGNRFAPLPQGLPSYLRIDSSAPAVAVDPSSQPGLVCHPVVSSGSTSSAVVQLDPATYSYEGCSCQAPFHAVVQHEGGRVVSMACVANQQVSSGVPLAHVLGPLLAVLAAALVALVFVGAAWRGGLAGLVQRITIESEKKMPPSAAKDITLVLTDVQGSTELWEWDQQLASDAFKVHDRILRQYMTQFYGYEVSTEGDAFLVAFHEPFDAVAWCLCVQLALHYADWPEPLLLHKSTCMDTAETLELKRRERQTRWQNRMTRAAAAAPGSAYAQAAAAAASATRRLSRTAAAPGAAADPADPTGGDDYVPDTLPPAPLVAIDQDPGAGFEDECVEGSSSDNAVEERMVAEYSALSNSKDGVRNLLFRGLRVRMSIATGGVDSVRLHSVTQRAEYVGEVLRKVQAVGETPQGGQVMMDSDTFRGIHSRLPELGGVVLEATQKLLRNNRAAGPNAQELVDMFSQMPPAAANSEAMHRNDFISRSSPTTNYATNNQANPNAAHSTITVMPAVAENNDKGANGQASGDGGAGGAANGAAGPGTQPRGWSHAEQLCSAESDIENGRINASPVPRMQRGLLHHAAALLGFRDDDSVSSSMEGLHGAAGSLHDSPSPSPHPDSSKGCNASALSSTIGGGMFGLKGFGVPSMGQVGQGRRRRRRDGDVRSVRRRSSLSYGVMVIDMGVHQLSGLPQKVNLIQAMPCGLEDRARFFPRLDSLRQETPGYFDAPAAGLAPLSPGANTAGITMPTVTIVFCTVDKYCEIVEVNREAAELALELYSDCVRWLLLVGGGYECQEAEGTFMVAFSSADVAIEWCLMVQQVLRDMSWPASVLELPTCEEERDMHGNIMFRGPRVKMGIYSGTPTRVIPHTTTGRADYFGPLVNRAARYCHAAARGGQVLVPKELMCEVISKWVLIDPTELMQSDRLLEFVAYFDEERRLWPWMFKRRTHWDVPMPPHLYPHLPVQVLPEDGAATPGTGLGPTQQQPGQWWGPGERAGAANTDAAAAAGIGIPGVSSRLQLADTAAAGVSAAVISAGKEQRGSTERCTAADELVKSSSDASSQNQSSFSDLMPVRLAPLHEAAECSSSKCPSEGEPPAAPVALSPATEHQQLVRPQQQAAVCEPTVPRLPPIQPRQVGSTGGSMGGSMGYEPILASGRGVRRHSDLAQAVSRLGPQALQQLQSGQYSQPGMTPVGVQSSGNSLGSSVPYSPAGWRQVGPVPPASVAAALIAQQSRYRRPSYLSDISASARYRRYSNMSDNSSVQYSSAGATMSSGTGFAGAGGWGGSGGGPTSRRNSAMSDFFPVGQHSRRPSSQMSADATGFLSPPGSAGMDVPTAAAAAQQAVALSASPRVQQHLQQSWQQQQQYLAQPYLPASPRPQQMPYYQQQQPQPQFHMHQRAAVVGPNAYPGQPAALPGLGASYQQIARTPAGAGVPPTYPLLQQQQLLQVAGEYTSEATANSQQQQTTAVTAAVGYQGRKSNGAQVGVRFSTPQQQPQPPQQPLPHSGPSSLPGVTDSAQNSTTLSNPVHSTSTGSRGSGGGRPVPAAALMQGLESQVLPGMLHSSNRLRLVSKRRRQMSYCFFQESSKPGIPAEGADPKRLLPAGYVSSGSVSMGLGGIPASNYAASEAATRVNGDRPGLGLIALGSVASSQAAQGCLSGPPGPLSVTGAPTSVGSGGVGSAGVSRRGSGRSNSNCGSGMAESNLGSGDDGAAPAASISGGLGGEFPHGSTAAASVAVVSRLDESSGLQPREKAATGAVADVTVAPPAAATWAGGSNAAMDGLCGLPEIDPLPDVDVMESLRLSVPQRGHRPSSMSTATGAADSVAGFEGPSIGDMCADIMRGRWLWIGELLVHDLGQFKFKGVAGVHSIVSVTSEELGGRTFPTTIRRGKGEQIRLGRGLLALVQMLPTHRPATWLGPYQGQQLLQNPAPPMALSEVHQQQTSPHAVQNMCHACGGMGGATNSAGQPMNHLGASNSMMQPAEGPAGPQQMFHMDLNCNMQGGQGYMGEMPGPLQRGPYGSGNYEPAVAAAFPGMPGRMRRGGSLGDLRGAHQGIPAAASVAAQYSVAPLQQYASAPESDATSALEAATGPGTLSAASSLPQGPSRGFTTGPTATPADVRSAGSSSIGQYHAGWHEDDVVAAVLPHSVHPRHTPSQAAQQFWHMQTHLWQLQLQQQQQRQRQRQQQQQRRRRHSVCMGSMQSRFWARPYGLMGEMMPFLETEEWPAPGSVSLPSPTPDQQQSEPQLAQALGSVVDLSFADLVPQFASANAPTAAAVGELSRTNSARGSVAAPGVSPFTANSSSVIDDDDAHHTSDVGSVTSDVMDAPRAKTASRHSHSASTAASARDEPSSAR